MADITLSNDNGIPGTVHLVDLEGLVDAQHASGTIKDVVLIPTPSNDPNDPLNWTPRRKLVSTACTLLYVLAVAFPSSAIYSVFMPIIAKTGIPFGTLNEGTGYMFLFFGWGCAFWQPVALHYGKRPVYLFSVLATLGITMWGPYVETSGQWIASKILQGFVGAPVESLPEISMTDISFTYKRGAYMTLYAFFLVGSNYIAPTLAGFISNGQDWEWVLYWCAIFCGLSFVILCLFMEETNYDRPPTSPNPAVVPEEEDAPLESNEKVAHQISIPTQMNSRVVTGSTKTFLQKMSLRDKPRPFKRLLFSLKQPFQFFTFPVVLYGGFASGSALIWFNFLNATASLIYSGPPYNFKPSMVGLTYISPFLGNALCMLLTGTMGDKLNIYLARRSQGISEPEHRLWPLILTTVFGPMSLILWGVGAANSIHWFGLVAAEFLLGVSITITIPIACNYAIDTYQQLGGEALVAVVIVRNTMSFAIGYGITPWIEHTGIQNTFIAAAFIGLAETLVFLVFVKFGKRFRRDSKKRYAKMVSESALMGHGEH
ncbi:hypothetical protein HYFRA_00012745 [Hymenoscyphus fraxineus]|uniref:MFS transporter n=1 Tax=Hymenoscyphus fraxineus TaxID=746836 RepID=A0A9N9L9X6_9HELO|nr:hypothetical protein HYFRA_00012745 [Hymenoscyphus fraxineus]